MLGDWRPPLAFRRGYRFPLSPPFPHNELQGASPSLRFVSEARGLGTEPLDALAWSGAQSGGWRGRGPRRQCPRAGGITVPNTHVQGWTSDSRASCLSPRLQHECSPSTPTQNTNTTQDPLVCTHTHGLRPGPTPPTQAHSESHTSTDKAHDDVEFTDCLYTQAQHPQIHSPIQTHLHIQVYEYV